MPQKPSTDWFAQNAPATAQKDWFAENAKPTTPEPERTVMGDLFDTGKGFVKRGIGTALELSKLGSYGVPGAAPFRAMGTPDVLKPTNERQQAGMLGFDIGSLVPASIESSASKLLPRAANWIERWALPGLTKEGAEVALSSGAAHASPRSAVKLATAGKNMQGARTATGQWMPGPEGLRNARDVITAESKISRPFTTAELAALFGASHYGGPELGAATAALSLLRRPKVTTALAQGLYSTSPVTSGIGGGLAAMALKQLFGGSDE